ncbi:cell surface protein SprA [Flavobacterium sp. '19STA2R22 D10 B1']|uniref:T9SS outer membrane translocon Sov/SprA n=1 Tax=Flavobacterium aerium TaxID=3037261 RepID=UPI00278C1FB9|nr:cell surface protein SprA [Flavobacterium sp. '19STA2R22 D10 B1']
MRRLSVFFLVLFFNIGGLQAQEDEEVKDTIKPGFDVGKVTLGNPPSILEAYTYDPVTDRYIYTYTFEGFNINYPIILTPKEYEELVLRESMRKYFRQKSDAIDGKKEGSDKDKKDLLPRYYVNSGFFESIFGGNTIDVKPTGSVEMDIGMRHTKQDNPSFSPRNRKTTTFDFDQRISLSLMGQVGTRLKVNANYDTESTFAFQNLIKLEYTPTEDDILQKIEVGNVSLPLNSSLIRGAQSLFGVKAQFQFGKTTITGIFSEQKSQTKTVTAQGGGTIQQFELFGLDYDADRHFFLSQYFRNQYDFALRSYPFIDSRVQITRMEVWVTNRQNRVSTNDNNLRNIIALQDLGESQLTYLPNGGQVPNTQVVALDPVPAGFFVNPSPNIPSNNKNNKYDPGLITTGGGLLNNAIREIATAGSGFTGVTPSEGTDYSKLENARKLATNEYTYHPQLGYISLNQRLSNDEVLAVAYQYTIGGEVYQVGEFGTDGVDATNVGNPNPVTGQQPITTQSLILKMLKSNLTSVNKPVWNLMMKNVYQIPGAFQLEKEDFKFNILYTDPSPLNYISAVPGSIIPPSVAATTFNTPLLKVMNVDRLNFTNDPQEGGDGFFDFIPGLTVDQQNGRIIFTTVEPFGSHLFKKLSANNSENYDAPSSYNPDQNKYVFRSMYRSTQAGALQDSQKNKFQLKGKFKSTSGDGIPIGAFNVPQGSVIVTAGGRVLLEGVDYTVNYQLGRVQILDPSLQASGIPIEISVENNSVFGQQTRRFAGVNIEHKFSDKFLVGATFLKMTERPFTQKSNYGQESVNNTIFGFNTNFSTEVPFLTRLVNKLPNIDTDVPSNFSFRGEIAYLKPGTPKADKFEGESTIYVDDFEGSQTTIDMRSPFAWSLASAPVGFGGEIENGNLDYGFKRAKLSWYTIDPTFYTGQRPSGISNNDISFNRTRRIYSEELYPVTDIAAGQSTVVSTLDLTYYPAERGPYNFNPLANGGNTLPNPANNWGGIMRAVNSTNFEQANVEYIQFWVLDPYFGNASDTPNPLNTGKIVFNLGEISEDVLKDGRKFYENGLPVAGGNQNVVTTVWGKVPVSQSLIYAFDTNEANRTVQDLGLNGLNDAEERALFPAFASLDDPAADNYEYFLNAQGNIIERYKRYNGLQGNSPVNVTNNNRGYTTLPDVEDINRDNTMNTINAYYKFSVDITPTMGIGQQYVSDVRVTSVSLPNGTTTDARWVQFKIPILEATDANREGGISDFRSIRFMRMFMTGFTDETTLRFGSLDLVRGEWRRYTNTLQPLDPVVEDDDTGFDVLAVNIQENGNRSPIKYVTPPGVVREQLYNNNTIINQNEQSLSLRVYKKSPASPGLGGLEPEDSRAVFKNVSVDMRQYKKLKMFLHAESLPLMSPNRPNGETNPLLNNQMIAFIRFGNDFTENFYQVEIPLKVTAEGAAIPEDIWPLENEMDLSLSLLTQLKILAMNHDYQPGEIFYKNEDELDPSAANKPNKLKIGVRGNPNFGYVRTIMVGLKNNYTNDIRGEVWFNELRLSDMDNKGGMAAVASIDANLADFATISATGRMSTIGFGSLEQSPNERSREDAKQYDIVTNMNLGKLLPKKWGVNLPFNYAVGEQIITPEYDPFNQDIKLKQLIDVTTDQAEKDNLRDRAIDYTKRKSINFIGVKKERGAEQKQRVYDPENLTLSYSFNQTEHHDYEIEEMLDQQVRTAVDYNFNFQPKVVEPFKKTKFMKKSSYWKLLSDFNFNYLPTNITFSSNIVRQYNMQKFRQVDVEGIGLDPLYRRNYMFNYQYGFNYNLTKALRFSYTASTSNIVRSYLDENRRPVDSYTIWDDYWNIGDPNQHMQQLVVNYDLPINKLPMFSFVKSTYSYTSDYNWQRSSDALSRFDDGNGTVYNLGNTIQNANSHRLNTTLNMDSFYKYIGLTKSPKKAGARNLDTKAATQPAPGQKITKDKIQPVREGSVFMDGLIGVLTSVKNIQINYTQNNGTVLPGYLPSIGFLGSSRPSIGFILGSQDDVRYNAARNGWLTNYPDFNQNFTQVSTKMLNLTAAIDLFPDFKIDLNADRTHTSNYSEQYDITNGEYNSRSPYSYGNFSISTVMIKTSFGKSDDISSAAFDDFRSNRITVANRLATSYYGTSNFPTGTDGFPVGFGKNSQAVLLPSFLAAYTGADASGVSLGAFRNVPIPNWSIKYTGLMRYKFFKDKFKRFSLQHNYRASYTINSFRSNLDYDRNPGGVDAGGNFFNKMVISNINLVEQFNPLIRVDFEMKNSFKVLAEMKKDRALSMSFDNNLLTEVKGIEYVLGLGYRFKDVVINSRLADNPTNTIKSDINLRGDISWRNNETIVRYLDYDNNQLAGGQNIWSVKLTADYSFSKNLTAIFYYDHSFSKAVISTSFPLTNIRAGFTLRYNFGN